MKKKMRNNQSTTLDISRVPLIVQWLIYVRWLSQKRVYPWMRTVINLIVNYASQNYPMLRRVVRVFRGVELHKLKDLGLFSTPVDPELGDESKQIETDRNYDIWYPFTRIPDVRSFKVQLAGFDWIFALFDIRKRLESNMKFEKYQNAKYNRYMEHQLSRLEKCRLNGNSVLYFRICDSLIRYSSTFYVWQLNRTVPNWHRKVPLWKIEKLLKEYVRQVMSLAYRIKYVRVFIPKANGKQRPLGVPTIPWRIRLGLWNKFLLKFLKGKISIYQHAYQPNKGTMSAWRQIAMFADKYRNVYSIDLTKYFDRVSLKSCIESLERKGVPSDFCQWLYYIHLSLPANIMNSTFEPNVMKHYEVAEKLKRLGHSLSQMQDNSVDLTLTGHLGAKTYKEFQEIWKFWLNYDKTFQSAFRKYLIDRKSVV